MTFRILIVGCGRIAGLNEDASHETHASVASATGGFSISACVDPSPERLEVFRQRYGAVGFASINDALASQRFDVVVISSPGFLHVSQLIEVIEHPNSPGIIFAEKPIYSSSADFDYLMKLAHHASNLVLVNLTRRLDYRFQELKSAINKNTWGRLLRVRGAYYGGWFNNGSHWIDAVSFLTGDKPRLTESSGYLPLSKGDFSADFSGQMVRSGARLAVASMQSDAYQLFEFDFWFEHSRLRIENFGNRFVLEVPELNQESEAVLVSAPSNMFSTLTAPLGLAYREILRVLNGGSSDILETVELRAVEPTLRLMLKGRDLAVVGGAQID